MFSSLSSKLPCCIFIQTEGGDHERLFSAHFSTEPRRMSHPVCVQPAKRFGFLDEKESDSNFQNAAGPESLKRWEGGKQWRDGGRLPSSCLTQPTSSSYFCASTLPHFFFCVLSRGGGQRRGRQQSTGLKMEGWEKGKNVKMKVKEKPGRGFKKT